MTMLKLLLATVAIVVATAAANAQQRYPATLAGHAILPANTLIAPPGDAPEALRPRRCGCPAASPAATASAPTSRGRSPAPPGPAPAAA